MQFLGLEGKKLSGLDHKELPGGVYFKVKTTHRSKENPYGLLIADAYQREADELLANNKEIQYLLDDDAAGLKVNERLAAYNLLQNNIISSTKLKEKAVKLRQKASTLTKLDRVSIAAEQDRLAWKSMVTYEINERERKTNQKR